MAIARQSTLAHVDVVGAAATAAARAAITETGKFITMVSSSLTTRCSPLLVWFVSGMVCGWIGWILSSIIICLFVYLEPINLNRGVDLLEQI